MCDSCGCSGGHHHHGDDDPHFHVHADGTAHSHPSAEGSGRSIEVRRNVLAGNEAVAAETRKMLDGRGIVAVNLISSPGAGKTTLLEKTLEALDGEIGCAVVTGDQRTDNDARRLSGKGANVAQIETGDACHLNAGQVAESLDGVLEDGTKLLFIENVGNLVCPVAFDLGEHFKIALLSVAEGEDKPSKYPSLFATASVVALTKIDLLPHLDFDLAACRKAVRGMRPGAFIFELSAKTGEGMDKWLDYLRSLVD